MKDKYKKYIDYIVNDIELPYLKYLNMYGLKYNEMKLVLSKVFNEAVIVWNNHVYNSNNNNLIYREDSDGYWIKREYDANGNVIYGENSDGDWIKREYDTNGNTIYCEYSDGVIEDNRVVIIWKTNIKNISTTLQGILNLLTFTLW